MLPTSVCFLIFSAQSRVPAVLQRISFVVHVGFFLDPIEHSLLHIFLFTRVRWRPHERIDEQGNPPDEADQSHGKSVFVGRFDGPRYKERAGSGSS